MIHIQSLRAKTCELFPQKAPSKIFDCNYAHNILRLLDILPNFPFIASEMKRDYW